MTCLRHRRNSSLGCPALAGIDDVAVVTSHSTPHRRDTAPRCQIRLTSGDTRREEQCLTVGMPMDRQG